MNLIIFLIFLNILNRFTKNKFKDSDFGTNSCDFSTCQTIVDHLSYTINIRVKFNGGK